jgi:hypothetical protein
VSLLKTARAKAQRRKDNREKNLEIDEIDFVDVFSVESPVLGQML